MRKQCLFVALLLSFFSLSLLAERRSEDEARRIAANYLQLSSQSNALRRAKQQGGGSVSPYYVYNSDKGGFAIISGSDRLPALIGYSDQGNFDPNDPSLPDNLRYWLEYASQATTLVETNPSAATLPEKNYGKDYGPLLGNINFNQNYPYNKQCPQGTYTGCMATAMSQVLAYHKYPAQGSGWSGVNYNGYYYSADLSTPAFDWDNLLPDYKGVNATARQEDAVAQLHYYVGLALELHYGTDATAGVSTKYCTALRDNFSYNKYVSLINRDCFTYGEWVDILLNEFEHGRPVLYDGVSGSGGHAFVIDGYRASDGMFHVNWGWGSVSNGYFNITMLNPTTTGIGASLSSGFSAYQDAVINITPEQEVGTYYTPIYSYANGYISSTSIGEVIPAGYSANIGVNYMANYSDKAFSGRFGVVVMQGDTEMQRIEVGSVSGRASTFDLNNEVVFSGSSWTVPSLPDGDYRVYVYVEQSGYPASILHTHTSRPNYLNMHMRDGKATFSMTDSYPTSLQLGNWNIDQQQMTMSDNRITVDVTNTGTSVENGQFALQFDAPHRLTQVLKTEQVRILPGETRTLTFWVDLLEYGTYTVHGLNMDRMNTGGKTVLLSDKKVFHIYRDVQTTRNMLRDRLAELQNIINTASYGNEEGQYPSSARDQLQTAINNTAAQNYNSMEVAKVQSLYDQLEQAADAFFRSMNVSVVTKKWSYVGDAPVTTGWSLGALENPAYFGISVSASELAPYRGGKIVGISALFGRRTSYQSPQPNDLTTQVLLLDYNGHPGERVLASSDNVHPTTQTYEDFYFNEPYVIGDVGVMAVCKTIQHKDFYSAMGACGDVAKPGACWLNNGNGWEDIYYTYGSTASAHAIKLIIQGGQTNIVDAVLEDVTAEPVMVNQPIVVKGYVKNAYHKNINKVTLQYTMDDGTLGNAIIDLNIEPEGREAFTLNLPAFSQAKLHTMQLRILTVDGMNDMVESNSNVRITMPVSNKNYVRNVVVEDHVSSECPYSPRSITTYEAMKQAFGERFIGISVHTDHDPVNTDPMAFPGYGYNQLLTACPTTPSGLVDRKAQLYTTLFPDALRTMIEEESRMAVAQVAAEAAYDPATRKITVQTKTEFGFDYSNADYRLCYVIVEDQVGPYNQRGQGTVLHDNVAREIVTDYKGLAGVLPQYAVAGHTYDYACRFSMPDNVDQPEHVRIITLLLDGVTGHVLNASSAAVTIEKGSDTPNIDDIDKEQGTDDNPQEDDEEDEDDFEFEFDDDGFLVINVTLKDGVELNETDDNLPTDILHYVRHFDNTSWQQLYVPFAIPYKYWKKNFEVAEWKELRQFDRDGDGVADSTALRFDLLGEGDDVMPNRPYLIRAKEVGKHEITLPKALISITKRNDIQTATDFARIDIKGGYETLDRLNEKGYYTFLPDGRFALTDNPDDELASMRWYMTITDPVSGQTYAPNAVSFCVGSEFIEESTEQEGEESDGDGEITDGEGEESGDDGEITDGDGEKTEGDGEKTEGDGEETEGDGEKTEGDGEKTEVDGEKTEGDGEKTEGDIKTTVEAVEVLDPKKRRIYSLDGRFVGNSFEKLRPGIYIQNGRKVRKK
ncbi:MAG: C10 family peptidase [Bacteroidales bacterium]|nr:C10 family peptidase [Candidatus Physcousia equi]